MPNRKFFSFLLTIVCLVAAACAPFKSEPGRSSSGQPRRVPEPPKPGEPINIAQVTDYFERELTNLLHQGRLVTNLLHLPRPKSCNLALSSSTTATPDFAALETSVVAVGGLAKIKGTPRLTNPGSGFFLTESGALATCWHVIKRPGFIGFGILTRDGRVCPVQKILAVDEMNDLVILQVEGAGFRPLPLAAEIQPGATVWVIGNPAPFYFMLTSGIVSGRYVLGRKGEMNLLNITADFANGSSGAPVFNEHGAVVAIAQVRGDVGIPNTPQMTIKGCVPATILLKMINQE